MKTPLPRLVLALCLVLLPTGGPALLAQEKTEQAPAVVEIVLPDDLGVPRDVILHELKTKVGQSFNLEKLREDTAMLWRDFRIQANATTADVPGGVKVVFTGKRRLEVDSFVFRGNDEKTESTIKELIGITPAQVGDMDDLTKAAQRLEDGYHDDGFGFAKVEKPVLEKPPSGTRAIFQIYEGPRVAVDDIEFPGLESFAPRHLRSLMGTSRSFLFFKSYYKESVLKRDLTILQEFLRGEGFRDATVGLEELRYESGGSWVTIVIRVVEGERYTVKSIDVECLDESKNLIFPKSELLGLLKLKPGEFYRDPIVRKDFKSLRDHYGEQGYIRFEWQAPGEVVSLDEPSIALTYRFRIGARQQLRDVVIKGTTETREVVVRRMIPLYPGDWFNTKEIEYAKNRLRGLGYFYDQRGGDRVKMEPKRTSDPRLSDLLINVEEGPSGFFTIVVGTQTSRGIFAGITITKNNFDISNLPSSPWAFPSEFFERKAFHGGGQRLSMNLLPGTVESNYEIDFEEPFLFGPQELPWSLGVDLHKSQLFFSKYDQDRTGATITVGKTLSRDLIAALSFRNELVDISSVDDSLKSGDPLNPSDFEQAEGDNGVRSLRWRLSYDGRDNYRNPSDGWRTLAMYEHAGGFLGADVEYARVMLGVERYVPLWENEKGEKYVLYSGLKVGQQRELGGADEIPFFERFFGGAATNDFLTTSNLFQLRGFDFRGVGPHFGSEAVGGNFATAATLEYQFPIASFFDPPTGEEITFLKGVVFSDAGTIAPDFQSDDVWLWRLSVGVGVRIRIPVPLFLEVPLKIDYGIPLLKQDEDDRRSFLLNLTTRF